MGAGTDYRPASNRYQFPEGFSDSADDDRVRFFRETSYKDVNRAGHKRPFFHTASAWAVEDGPDDGGASIQQAEFGHPWSNGLPRDAHVIDSQMISNSPTESLPDGQFPAERAARCDARDQFRD